MGKGGGGMTRFQISTAGETGKTIIRLIQQDKRSMGGKGRKYTPMKGGGEPAKRRKKTSYKEAAQE